MRKLAFGFLLALCAAAAACSSFYKAQPEMRYYHGRNVPEGYIKIASASAEAITFEIRVEFSQRQLYHLVLDGDTPVAQGWFPTSKTAAEAYTVTLTPREGFRFESGKAYRLCIGSQNPEEVQLTSSNYRCMVDYEFTMK